MIYLLHFAAPMAHAQHYIGWADDGRLFARLAEHEAGRGAVLTQHFYRAGICCDLVRTWPGDRTAERALKDRKNARELCPRCSDGYKEQCRLRMRRLRGNKKRRAEHLEAWRAGAVGT